MAKHRLYIVLTQTNTTLSKLIRIFKQDKYTHASISLDRNLKHMYSFGRRSTYNPFIGCFRREDIHEGVYGLCRTLPSAVIELKVTSQQYKKAQELLNDFIAHQDKYKYNYWGLINGLFDRPLDIEDSFLCSEFVYHILYESGIVDLQIPRNLVRPQDLLQVEGSLVFQGDLKTLRPQKNLHLYPREVIAG